MRVRVANDSEIRVLRAQSVGKIAGQMVEFGELSDNNSQIGEILTVLYQCVALANDAHTQAKARIATRTV